MLASVLRNTELSHMADLVSPALWRVVPLRRLWAVTRQLVSNYRDRESFGQAAAALEPRLSRLGAALGEVSELATPVSALEQADADQGPLADPQLRRLIGQRVLELYFAQLMRPAEQAGGVTLLDLRPARLGVAAEELVDQGAQTLRWAPNRFYLRFSDAFGRAVQGLYLGFYRDDERRFAAALETLELGAAEQLFRRHFGDGRAPQRFALSQLLDTLHEVFMLCDREGVRLSGEFVALGFYLTSLYQTLELLDVPLDVRAAFDAACAS